MAGKPDMPVFTINPKVPKRAKTGADVQWLASLDDLPADTVDLAVVAVPAEKVPEAVAALGKKGVGLAVVISAGLKLGDDSPGADMMAAARAHGVRIIGPNCLGVLVPRAGINASFSHMGAREGGIALISQSGALTTALLDWASTRQIGMSAAISVGDMADVDFADLMMLFADDADTNAILLYIEGIVDGPAFLDAARAAAGKKPVIAIKAGRGEVAAQAARSHTGALAGAYDVYHAALSHAGIVVVDNLAALFDAASVLPMTPMLAGEALGIVTNGGGGAVLAVDALEEQPGHLAALAAATIEALDPVMPAIWSGANPVDIIGDASPERYAFAIKALLHDAAVDALLVINCPTALADSRAVADMLVDCVGEARAHGIVKPVIGCWMGDANAERARGLLAGGGVPLFTTPEAAVAAFSAMVRARRAADAATVWGGEIGADDDLVVALEVIAGARADGRNRLSEIEGKTLLAAFGIPVVPTRLAADLAAVRAACEGLEPPLVVKIVSPDISHKSDFGGVVLGLSDACAAHAAAQAMEKRLRARFPAARLEGFAVQPMIRRADANEVFAGLARDKVFGPVLLFGAGGKAIEVIRDRSISLPPLMEASALAMIGDTRIGRLLAGYRDVAAADREAVAQVLLALSRLALALPQVREVDINPLLSDANGVLALDARILLE